MMSSHYIRSKLRSLKIHSVLIFERQNLWIGMYQERLYNYLKIAETCVDYQGIKGKFENYYTYGT